MAKELIVAVMEEVVGEYILNISKENIKIAALRGKLKLENVQLDGDLIGSHVLGAVGLSGFGVLSCWARSVKAAVPIKNLEKEPTRFEIHGLHLVCVPLLPSTANREYGAGTAVDPRCTLRTRAKRSALARFERNYFSGRIPGEGPPSARVRRAIIEAERVLRKGKSRWKGSFTANDEDTIDTDTRGDTDAGSELEDDSGFSDSEDQVSQMDDMPAAIRIPIVANNWKTKLRQKMLRNMECKIEDLHIRCEVSEQGLDFSQPEDQRQQHRGDMPAEQRAFSFGLTLDSLYVKTANDKWEVGSETANSVDDISSRSSRQDDASASSMSAATASASTQSAGVLRNKILEINNASIYWDDDPPLLISETYLLRSNEHKLSPVRLQARVGVALDAMKCNQHPGAAVIKSLSASGASTPTRSAMKKTLDPVIPHHYILENFSWKAQVKMGDRNQPGPMTVIAEFLPVEIDLYFRPHQYMQYCMLRSAMLSQQRFDTMLRQRPTEEPASNPLAWWKYAISCVTTRPNSRPWVDVQQICKSRQRYVELVVQNVLNSSGGNGFHGGLDDVDSLELLALEELLPIEALMSFHLLALRKVYELQLKSETEEGSKSKRGRQSVTSSEKIKTKPRFRRFRKALSGGGSKSNLNAESGDSEADLLPSVVLPGVQPSDSISRSSLEEAISARLGKKTWHNTFFLNDAKLTIHLLDPTDDKTTLQVNLRMSGKVRRLGPTKFDLSFDVMRFEVVDCRHLDASSMPSHFFADGKILSVGEPRMGTLFTSKLPDSQATGLMPRSPTITVPGINEADRDGSSRGSEPKPVDLALPCYSDLPSGVVCRLGSSKGIGAWKLSISAHPVTLVWHKSSIHALSEFFASSTSQLQTELTRHLRNVATPLARKAQLALLSPDAITVDVNMAAPKIWVPVSSESNDAVFLDAGRFRVDCAKKEKGTDTQWEVIARDIQVMFVRLRRGVSRTGKVITRDFSVTGVPDSEELQIIRPFHIRLCDSFLENIPQNSEEIAAKDDQIVKGPIRKTTVSVSPIRLTLVDAEVLARAIGKWYAQGIGRVKGRATSLPRKKPSSGKEASVISNRMEHGAAKNLGAASVAAVPVSSSSHIFLVKIEKVEMAIEGHSKSSVQISDDQSVTSFASVDTFMDPTPRKRTYIVEVFDIVVDRTKKASTTRTMLTVQDASIARLKENSSPYPSFVPQESQYLILVRAGGRPDNVSKTEEEGVEKLVFQPILESPANAGDKYSSVSASPLDASSSPAAVSGSSPPIGISGASPHADRLQLSPGNYSETPKQTMEEVKDKSPILSASLFHDSAHHIDEVEIDIDSIIVRVTPTSLKDSAKGLRRVLELAELTTKEMERKVHEEGRNARRMERLERNRDLLHSQSSVDRPISPAESDWGTDVTNTAGIVATENMIDSSILFKVTLRESAMLIGRPVVASGRAGPIMDMNAKKRETPRSNAVVQVWSKSLIMFQSIENSDGSGSKTLHTSLDNFSIALNTEFEPVSLTEVPPAIGPTASEIRVVYATENLGCVVSQDVSLDCESVKACLAPEDIKILDTVARYVLDRLRSFGVQSWLGGDQSVGDRSGGSAKPNWSIGSLIRYQKKGTGIATRLRLEVQLVSFVLLRTFRPNVGAIPIFDLNVKALKGNVEGCMSALSGEIAALVSTNFFNTEIGDWEYALEPFQTVLAIDQMPNELVLKISTGDNVPVNLTSMMLKDIAEMDFNLLKSDQSVEEADRLLAALESLGKRRATESCSVKLVNESGLDFFVYPSDSSKTVSEQKLVGDGSYVFLESFFGISEFQKLSDLGSDAIPTLALSLAPSSSSFVGDRQPIQNLPAVAASTSVSLHRLVPVSPPDPNINFSSSSPIPPRRKSGRGSPDTTVSGLSMAQNSTFVYYNAEPVVEWCMQNQRLRSSVNDVYSLDSGRDLLTGSVWSPDNESNHDPETWQDQLHDEPSLSPSWDDGEQAQAEVGGSLLHPRTTTTSHLSQKGNWVRPYLKNDSPEWTDMTCVLRMARERVMLPDNNWIWLDDWTVDLSGKYGEETDADGWEYEADFETFNKTRRSYTRGDACRRRRWTRTRIVRPPKVDDTHRQLSVVWETLRDENGNFTITLKSNLVLHNTTASPLSFFAYSPSWEDDKFLGDVKPGEKLFVPVQFACATNLRIAQRRRLSGTSINDFAVSRRVMIVPTSYSSSVLVRTSIKMSSAALETAPTSSELHYLVRVECEKGVVDVFVEPVLKIVNLLPCELQCELGELSTHSRSKSIESSRKVIGGKGKRVVRRETITIPTGDDAKFTAVNPASKPFMSLRVPGYQWSPWQRVVNRKADSYTWHPSRNEEEMHLRPDRGDVDYMEEFKSIVCFERIGKAGDPLVLIVSVEVGHCPTIRVYAQYWILDKTGFGCRFCDGFADILGSIPDSETSRRSHLLPEEAKDPEIRKDMNIPGHQWPIGMSGMSLFFSSKEKFSMSIESGVAGKKTGKKSKKGKAVLKSKWVSPMDVSIVMPKTVFSVDEQGGSRRFDLAMSVAVCPDIYVRTKLITLFPRYQIVNLLKRQLVVAQEGCLEPATVIPSQSSVPAHRERQSLPPRMRLGMPNAHQLKNKDYEQCWSSGCIQLDKIGITSMRLPEEGSLTAQPMVVQAEVRLATKEQPCAVVVVIWSTSEKSNPLYLLRNLTSRTIICRQPLQDEGEDQKHAADALLPIEACTGEESSNKRWGVASNPVFECGAEIGPIVRHFLGLDRIDEFVWVLRERKVQCFGFDDPEKPHILEWTFVNEDDPDFDKQSEKGFVEIDAMGSTSTLMFDDGTEVRCHIIAEHSTKVIEFFEPNMDAKAFGRSVSFALNKMRDRGRQLEALIGSNKGESAGNELEQQETVDEEEEPAFSFTLDMPSITVGVVDNATPDTSGREILLAIFDRFVFDFSQNREGYHEFELTLTTIQVDNHVYRAVHPVLLFCPPHVDMEPLLHMSAVRRLQPHSSTFVFRYAAVRLLEVELLLDRRIAETVARFIDPLLAAREVNSGDPTGWVKSVTAEMSKKFSNPDRRAPRDVEQMVLTANSGRIYFEQLHLHPVRVTLTFTQEWMEWNPGTGGMIFQFIRGMASIANAPLTFTSFVVAHVFESPQALYRIISTHYSSQLTKQIFAIIGSLAILGAPADFISNVGTGVRDFFYEPINGMVHGPAQFLEGLEVGTQSLARGVFVGVVRGAANVTDLVNSNLAGLTADDAFIDERKAHQRMLTDAMSRGETNRTMTDSLYLAGASVARSVKSGAIGIVEQPTMYASRNGPVGFVKGVGKAIVGAVVKPVVGVGDAAVLVMNHVSEATSDEQVLPKIPKRLRRALPRVSSDKPHCVKLVPYDERAAKAQKIVTGGESVDDVYIGHVNIPGHLIISSEQCLWAIDRNTREPWCVRWEEISHFGMLDGSTMRITVFSQTGLKSYIFPVDSAVEFANLHRLLEMQLSKMGNGSGNVTELHSSLFNGGLENLSKFDIPGVKKRQKNHVFGSCNNTRPRLDSTIKDEIDVIEQCFGRVKVMGSESSKFFQKLDEEAWTLVHSWGQVFSGLSSRRCIAVSIINGTGNPIQIMSHKLVEGGSPCYSIPTKEYDSEQAILHPGGAIIFFAWGVVPNLLQAGNVIVNIETNAFVSELTVHKTGHSFAEAKPGYQVGFLEKSHDDMGWWAKFWLLVRARGE